MKKKYYVFNFLLIVTGVIILTACQNQNDPSNGKVLYLSKIKTNGKLTTEYIYDNSKYVQRINTYDTLTGTINSYNTYEYTKNNKVSKIHYFNKSTGTSQQYMSTGLYIFLFDNQDLIIKANYYTSETSTTINSYSVYVYNLVKQCIKYTNYNNDSTHTERYSYVNDYNGDDRVKCSYYNGSILKATFNYTYDDKVNYSKNLSTTTILYSPHNTLTYSSPDAVSNGGVVDTNGGVMVAFNKVSVLSYPNTSTFTYNSYNYPIKQTMNYILKPKKVDIKDFEYIE
ncbi:MAG: hypothetical protein WCK78_05080 [Paludibacter sp.]